jgi:hypothetical protein
VAFAG